MSKAYQMIMTIKCRLTVLITDVCDTPPCDSHPMKFLKLFLDESFFKLVSDQINLYADQTMGTVAAAGSPHMGDSAEMQAFFCLNVYFGIKI